MRTLAPIVAWLFIASACASMSPREHQQNDEPDTHQSQTDNAKPHASHADAEGQPRAQQQSGSATGQPNASPRQAVAWFGPETAPSWVLAIIAAAGALVAYLTLKRIEDEIGLTRAAVQATEEQAKAAKRSADAAERSLVLSNRAYVDVTNWELVAVVPDVAGLPDHFLLKFEIVTASPTPAQIESVILTSPPQAAQGAPTHAIVSQRSGFKHQVGIGPLSEEHRQRFSKPGGYISVTIAGYVSYTDVFKKERRRRFARVFTYYGPGQLVNHVWGYPDGPDLNAEERWGED